MRTLQALDIFAGATRAALERLRTIGGGGDDPHAGTVLIREGAEADDFFVLTAGEVAVSAAGEAGVGTVARRARRRRTTSARSGSSSTVHGPRR